MTAMTEPRELLVHLRNLESHPHQKSLVDSGSKRIIVRAGRRGGKTTGIAQRMVKRFLMGRRQSYGTPTLEQVSKCWFEVKRALIEPIEDGVFKCNESEHFIEKVGTEQRIKLRTVWNADTMRGDYGDDIYFDEWQLMDEDAWDVVGAPMLLDNNGDAVFIYTPPSLRSAGVSKARDPRHAAKMFKSAERDTSGRWQAIHFTSHDNPYISAEGLQEIIKDMSTQSYRQEILAEDDELQLSWLVYRAFKEDACKKDRREIPQSWLIYSGHDFGSANPAALFVAEDPATGQFWEFAEYLPGAGRSTAEHVEEFKKITEGYSVAGSWGGSPQEDEIRQGYAAHGWHIQQPKWEKQKTQIDKVIGMMELSKIYIFKDLYNRLEELMNCLWSPDTDGAPTEKIKDEAKYHLGACARYLYCNFTPETVVERGPITVTSTRSRGTR